MERDEYRNTLEELQEIEIEIQRIELGDEHGPLQNGEGSSSGTAHRANLERRRQSLELLRNRLENEFGSAIGVLNDQRELALMQRLNLNEERITEVRRQARETDEIHQGHHEAVHNLRQERNTADLRDSVQQVTYAVRNDAILAANDRGRTELMNVYGRDIEHNDKRSIVMQIKQYNFDLSTQIGNLASKFRSCSRNNQPSVGQLATMTNIAQKCLGLGNNIKAELDYLYIATLDRHDAERQNVIDEASNLMDQLEKMLQDLHGNLSSPNPEILRAEEGREIERLGRIVYLQLRNLPMPEADHENFDNVVARTMDAISNGGNVENQWL